MVIRIAIVVLALFWMMLIATSSQAGSVASKQPTYEIVVSFSDFTLHVFDRNGDEVFMAPVALPQRTPALPVEGNVIAIDRNPWWFPPPGVKAHVLKTQKKVLPARVPPGPHNPMGLAKFSFRFFTPGAEQLSKVHGTNKPDSIGTRASMGCIRMHNTDVVALCDLIEPKFKAGERIAISYVRDLEDVVGDHSTVVDSR
ncbi:MAG: hypothetical protein UX49_C0035G0004 [Candidatus Wolfebacteria bacterium GW2011_GWC2_46_275]|uniref:L,D-TPase catalytic domain-containing protein n=2 Tax=Candidatus Wolfeibacteriota TaxID=1752735 RepID=A0A0G1U5P3_9BACT|nr:MAG: putative ErfK/YbiS/YcfS/YnhG family protein [Candidatus Wolfebacteria bacterium GW2011_GWB1_47_1]KKU34783.1 MAG: hypothetical protein UX49_C0035G0004 [Candidatus Wolfebacteria bacterium GW2011_GWC2_46_275]KKU42431.1 MAG: hypothetical protein UX58_C0002G0145 [Candidatus Wolfebacteria bacterium GW2011_GWB2_46_69]KKU54215.1 MAG: hypothetical protein UX76_C0004G0019 [Candidatus Wolfebacteria bacterium GW2011_GWC1_47_103]KKU58693.1 MAG: hypothetical protein UX83_C0013G0003 [Candidatus Wolfeb